jgi:DNA-binding MarR family transcriptional regulator
MSEPDEDLYMKFANCLILNTIQTARAVTRRYDNRLKSFGVTVIQFSVMSLIRKHENMTINALAERIAMDRSTLTRNLDVLVRKGLVVKTRAEKGNAKVCKLTQEGDRLLDQLIPIWLQSREELQAILEGHDPDEYLAMLRLMAAG